MIWFGETWHAPICEAETHRPTPVGKICARCDQPIQAGDRGFLVPHMEAETATLRAWHRMCWMNMIMHDPATCPRCKAIS